MAFERVALNWYLLVGVIVKVSACCQGLGYLFALLIILKCY